ncbi:Uu.00g122030.m01.CDS01 [Anthostomella pinea]|uniref:Uu.00g122030.m01.CDS01 n=1 Tax=Anthostomella pinea TaxID=933095 RepID=A0AAI8VI54_9PEZI|nr:Uu.00g122030.m01.CDS01 [Anthostomella pinea]
MKKSSFAAVVFVLATSANATAVYLGSRIGYDGSESNIGWTNNTTSICMQFVEIDKGNASPCNINFYVDDHDGPYQFRGCGSGVQLYKDGVFSSGCTSEKRGISCRDSDITQKNLCDKISDDV